MPSHLFVFTWTGDTMEPLPGFKKRCDETFVVHERYRMEVSEERSMRSHTHFFASVHDAWLNLPEHLSERFANPDALRKYCLIKAGHRDERSITCASKAEAQRLAAFIKPMDDYAVVLAHEATLIVYTAKSQSLRAMGKKTFQASKEAVMTEIAKLIDITPAELKDNAGRAA